jgi:hypothetical protein
MQWAVVAVSGEAPWAAVDFAAAQQADTAVAV